MLPNCFFIKSVMITSHISSVKNSAAFPEQNAFSLTGSSSVYSGTSMTLFHLTSPVAWPRMPTYPPDLFDLPLRNFGLFHVSTRTESAGSPSFQCQAPVVWNSLPLNIHLSSSFLSSFKAHLKTALLHGLFVISTYLFQCQPLRKANVMLWTKKEYHSWMFCCFYFYF